MGHNLMNDSKYKCHKDIVYKDNKYKCYKCDNNFAYWEDVYREDLLRDENKEKVYKFIKIYNFVPTYDKWCLCCGKKENIKSKCGKCKSVYFCDNICQKRAWTVHKRHCGRNLFVVCATCGKDTNNTDNLFKCDKCPVVWCSLECKNELYEAHKDFDCTYFSKTFTSLYL